ncbi:nucleotidyltransferase family protein [Catenuloplanes atrovinosus]|uniref:Nicotine blue oxidoreductase n=1 Tax=Catenuloplanes atrovinosus TaxID=137266 RepID=A0AAE4C7U6_9ACTN|nr:NTP transferase domain-containing protein [Catenuloplanes atrovinosus]MDR7273942.1 nicotine blue oxidoreductase [Catenuloplanes atrovinosus]
MSHVAGLLLAAGAGRRYGMPKALVPLDGELLADRAARALAAGGCDPVLVVLGAAAADVRARAALTGADVVINEEWATGMGSSLRAGLTALARRAEVDAAVVLLVDTPGVSAAAVRRLAAAGAPDALAMGGYDDHAGHPVLLGRDHWAGVAALATGDVGARPYLRAHRDLVRIVPVGDVASDEDLDHPIVSGSQNDDQRAS